MPVSAKSEAATHPDPASAEAPVVADDAAPKGKVRLRTVGFLPGDFVVLGPVINPTKDNPEPERAEFRVTPEGNDFDPADAEVILEAAGLAAHIQVEKVDA